MHVRDVSDQRLYGMEGVSHRLLRGKLDERLILRHWDDIARVAGSLKMGWVTSSLFVSRLQAKPRKSGLTKALQEYGRLRKTIFLLRYMEDQDLRKRIGRQLNKGESLHALRDFLFFANAGKVGRRHPVKQTDQALCLNLVADCVILWNTIYYEEILTRLKDEGYPLKGGDSSTFPRPSTLTSTPTAATASIRGPSPPENCVPYATVDPSSFVYC